MARPKRKGRGKAILKSLLWGMTCLSMLGLLSCNSGTGSSTSSAGSSGTGTGWTITIQLGTNPIALGNTTTVLAIVRDRTGAPAPNGTNICFTAVVNGFLKPGASELFATICEETKNDRGQSIQTYQGRSAGADTIEIVSQGVVARTTIGVN